MLWSDLEQTRDLDSLIHGFARLGIPLYLVVGSGKGFHPYVKLAQPADPQLAKQLCSRLSWALSQLGFSTDLKVAEPARIMRIPGTYNNKYGDPIPVKMVLDLGDAPQTSSIQELESKLPNQIQPASSARSAKLSQDQIHEIAELLKRYYKPGHRDLIVFSLLGHLVKLGIEHSSARELVEYLARITNDEEIQQRLYLVDYHYGLRSQLLGLNKLKGISGLREQIQQALIQEGADPSSAADEALGVIQKLSRILGSPLVPKLISKLISESQKFSQCVVNDPGRGILLITQSKDGSILRRDYVLGYFLDELRILVDPLDRSRKSLEPVFAHPNTGDRIRYSELSIAELVELLSAEQYGVRSHSKLRDCLSAIIEGFVEQGIAQLEYKPAATGFLELDGKLSWFDSPRFPVELPQPDPGKLRLGLEALDWILWFHGYSDRARGNLYYIIQAPLDYIRKQHGLESKILLNYGEPHVGKTSLCWILLGIWGIRDMSLVIKSSQELGTPARLGEILDCTTLPILMDECTSLLADFERCEMLKKSTTSTSIRARLYLPGYRLRIFKAHAAPIGTANVVPTLYPGMEERLIPLEWTVQDKWPESKWDSYARLADGVRQLLGYIGSQLRELLIQGWDQLKPMLRLDQLELGRRLLELIYTESKTPIPSWLTGVSPSRYSLEQPEPLELICELIREDLLDCMARFRKELAGDSWEDRILALAQAELLPGYMGFSLKAQNIYLKHSLIQRLARKGYQIPGGLKNLALRYGFKYQAMQNFKAMVIPLQKLAELLKQDQVS